MTIRLHLAAHVFALALLAVPILSHTAQAQTQDDPLKIAVVNMDRVIAESAVGVALNEKIRNFRLEAQGQVQAQEENIQKLRQQVSDAVQNEDQIQLVNLQKQFEDAQLALNRFRDDKAREAQKIRAEGLQDIQTQFEPVFNAIQEEFNYDLILNQQSGVVMMVGERVDITETVIERVK